MTTTIAIPHELYNIETEEIQTVQDMTPVEASDRNLQLRRREEPYRWIPFNPYFE